MIVDALVFGVAVVFMLVGLVGMLVPLLPGTLIIWVTVLLYAIVEEFEAIDWITFTFITLIALASGTADLWMSLLGARTGGASIRSIVYGFIGGLVGFFVLGSIIPVIGSLFGGVIGYSSGVLLGQYQTHRDWNIALKASVGGFVGWGIATIVQFAGGIVIIAIFLWQVLAY